MLMRGEERIAKNTKPTENTTRRSQLPERSDNACEERT